MKSKEVESVLLEIVSAQQGSNSHTGETYLVVVKYGAELSLSPGNLEKVDPVKRAKNHLSTISIAKE